MSERTWQSPNRSKHNSRPNNNPNNGTNNNNDSWINNDSDEKEIFYGAMPSNLLKRYKASGILFFAKRAAITKDTQNEHINNITTEKVPQHDSKLVASNAASNDEVVFLLGAENRKSKRSWLHFGGKREEGENEPQVTAWRELNEESDSFFNRDWKTKSNENETEDIVNTLNKLSIVDKSNDTENTNTTIKTTELAPDAKPEGDLGLTIKEALYNPNTPKLWWGGGKYIVFFIEIPYDPLLPSIYVEKVKPEGRGIMVDLQWIPHKTFSNSIQKNVPLLLGDQPLGDLTYFFRMMMRRVLDTFVKDCFTTRKERTTK